MNPVLSIIAGQFTNLGSAAKTLQGNARTLLVTTLFGWTVFFAYLSQYLPIYLTSPEIGVSKEFFGTLCSITSAVALIGGFLSGAIAARFNAKIVLLCGDIITFSLSAVCWFFASADRPLLLILAAVFSGVWSFHNSCFQLLLTKGQAKATLPRLYAFFNVTISGVGFLTPLAGMLLVHFELVPLTRVMLLISAILVIAGAASRLFMLEEYRPEPDAEPPRGAGIRKTFSVIASEDRALWALLAIIFINGIAGVARFTYSGIYFTDGLGIPKAAISILPAISSIVVIGATLFALPLFTAARSSLLLRLAFLLLFLSDIGLLIAPRNMLPWLIVTSTLSGLGGFLSMSLTNSTIMNLTRPANWPYLVGINVPVFSLAGIIAGPIVGALYTHWPRLPFLVSASLTLVVLLLVFKTDFSPRHAPVEAPQEVEEVS